MSHLRGDIKGVLGAAVALDLHSMGFPGERLRLKLISTISAGGNSETACFFFPPPVGWRLVPATFYEDRSGLLRRARHLGPALLDQRYVSGRDDRLLRQH